MDLLEVKNDLRDDKLNLIELDLDKDFHPLLSEEEIIHYENQFYIVNVIGDGNCTLHAILLATLPIYQETSDTMMRKWIAVQLREQMANAILVYEPSYINDIDARVRLYEDLFKELDFDDLQFVCNIIKINLLVVNVKTREILRSTIEDTTKIDVYPNTLVLNFRYNPCHYNLVVCKRENGFSTLFNQRELLLLYETLN